MKKISNLFVAVLIVCGMAFSIPVNVRAEEGAAEEKDDTVFQKASDVINGKYEVKTVPFKKIGIFQKMADAVNSVSNQ